MKIVVIGAGAMGLSAGRVLAERGHRVEVLDAHQVSHRLGSSSGATRLWRLAHLERDMVALAQRTVSLWRDLERRAGTPLLLTRGLMVRGDGAETAARAVQAEGARMDLLDASRIAELFPEFVHDPRRPVFWQPEAGVVLAATALAVQARLLAAAGGVLSAGELVRSVEESSTGVTVGTDHGTRSADAAVLAAGPWSSALLADLGIDVALEPVLEQVSYFGGGNWEHRPCFYDWGDGIDGLRKYCMPTPGMGYKIGIDHPLRGFDAADRDRAPSRERTDRIESVVQQDFPGFEPVALNSEVCSYTNSPDDHFVLDRVGRVTIACGDSGQAFKFSPFIGEILADLTEGRVHPQPALFGLGRLVDPATGPSVG